MIIHRVTVRFKNEHDEEKYDSLDFRLKSIMELTCLYLVNQLVFTLIVSDISTPGIHMVNGPHYRRQAIDLSLRTIPRTVATGLRDLINGMYDYGRGYECALFDVRADEIDAHDDHIHLQVPPPYKASGRISLYG